MPACKLAFTETVKLISFEQEQCYYAMLLEQISSNCALRENLSKYSVLLQAKSNFVFPATDLTPTIIALSERGIILRNAGTSASATSTEVEFAFASTSRMEISGICVVDLLMMNYSFMEIFCMEIHTIEIYFST